MNNENNTPKPHPHAELIKAWADGAKIQYRVNNVSDWVDCYPSPGWYEYQEYRIKPSNEPWKPKEGISYLFVNSCGHVDFKLWESNTLDERHYKIGNCFHLQSAAEAAAERVKAALKGELKISAPNDEKIQLDGKPLTDGEKALIRALRDVEIYHVFDWNKAVICTADYRPAIGGLGVSVSHRSIAMLPSIATSVDKEKAIIAALKQIQAEQEEIDE